MGHTEAPRTIRPRFTRLPRSELLTLFFFFLMTRPPPRSPLFPSPPLFRWGRVVRSSCRLGPRGSMVIPADGRRRGGLRAGLGKKLDFGVYRDRVASPDPGTLSFGFGA